jgi:DNA-binding LacI/PurR family transcriptional regulator
MAARLKDVAERAGVAISTVNDVLSGRSEHYAAATCAKIRAAAKALNYKSDIAARGMREGKTYLLGILYSGVNYINATDFIAGFQQVVVAQSYTPVYLAHNGLETEKTNAEVLLSRRVDGLIVTPWIDDDGKFNAVLYEQLKKKHIPMVELFSRLLKGVPKVNLDNGMSARSAVQHLVERGHQRIVHFTHANYRLAEKVPGLYWNSWDFAKGYEAQMRAANLTPVIVTHEPSKDLMHPGFTYSRAYEAGPRLLQHPSRPTAIICPSEEDTEGLMHYAWRHPEMVPPGFEIVTVSIGEKEAQSNVPINYMCWSMGEVGAAAARSILALLKKEPADDVLIAPEWSSEATSNETIARRA